MQPNGKHESLVVWPRCCEHSEQQIGGSYLKAEHKERSDAVSPKILRPDSFELWKTYRGSYINYINEHSIYST